MLPSTAMPRLQERFGAKSTVSYAHSKHVLLWRSQLRPAFAASTRTPWLRVDYDSSCEQLRHAVLTGGFGSRPIRPAVAINRNHWSSSIETGNRHQSVRALGWRAPSSMRGRGRFWSHTGRSIPRPPPAHHLDIRQHDGRSEARPRGGPAQRDADLHERQTQPAGVPTLYTAESWFDARVDMTGPPCAQR
jgi:hypothetical protein